MPCDLVRTGSLVLALLGGTALSAGKAVAQQQQPPAAEPQQQQQQEKAQQNFVRSNGQGGAKLARAKCQAGRRFGVRQWCLGSSQRAGKY